MKRLLLLIAVLAGVALAFLKAYEVTPTKASWSGMARGDENYGVSQTFTANFDSVCEVQVFVGYLGASPSNPFKVDIYEQPSGDRVAYKYGVTADRDHSWAKFPMTTVSGQKFLRGKEYLLKVTRPRDVL